jgi:hypothetical protein
MDITGPPATTAPRVSQHESLPVRRGEWGQGVPPLAERPTPKTQVGDGLRTIYDPGLKVPEPTVPEPTNPTVSCLVPDCQGIVAIRGLCKAHYMRWYLHGEFREFILEPHSQARYKTQIRWEDRARARAEREMHQAEKTTWRIERARRRATARAERERGRVARIERARQRASLIGNGGGPSELGRVLGVSRQRVHQLLNPLQVRARGAVSRALESGRLQRPPACHRCRLETSDLEAHHPDYSRPLDVRWLCPACHAIVHPHHPRCKVTA